jgi:transposase InsO family protein
MSHVIVNGRVVLVGMSQDIVNGGQVRGADQSGDHPGALLRRSRRPVWRVQSARPQASSPVVGRRRRRVRATVPTTPSVTDRTSDLIRARVLALRDELVRDGHDAGADTLTVFLARENVTISRTTIWRILKAAGKVTPQPQKRPRSSWIRFTADRPNELWQSDFTHTVLADGTDVEVIGWLDDHARFLLHLTAHPRVTGRVVTDTFLRSASKHGYPAATLTDNGMVYTTRLARGGRGRGDGAGNAFETLLADLGITQKNGKPFKPTTQGKIEPLWQTLKKYLATRPATTIAELQQHLDTFRRYYNEIRPHRALNRKTPDAAYTLIPKAAPTPPDDPDVWPSATTPSTATGKSPSATAARCSTSASAELTAAPRSSASSTTTTPSSAPETPATSSPNSPSTPPTATNEKTDEPPKPGVHPFTMS